MQTKRTFIVTATQGIYLRTKPDLLQNSIIRTLTRGTRFFCVELSKIGDRTWAKNAEGQYICIANGQNFYVTEELVTPPPSESLDWHLAMDAWAREHGYKGPKP